jgi:hypothetical protein
MKTVMRVTKYILVTVFVTTMNVALAETEAKEPISDVFAGMFKHHFSKDWSFAVGTKLWIHTWQTFIVAPVEVGIDPTTGNTFFLPNSRGFVTSQTSDDIEVTPIPVASLRYKNLFVIASHYLDTDFDFPEITTAAAFVEFGVASLATDRLSASRLEWDASLGYFLHPYVAVTAGYKFIEREFPLITEFSFAGDPISVTFATGSKTEISGPIVGLIASVPIGRGFGVYGSFAYGFLESDFLDATGREFSDEQSQPYILAEGGFTYTYGADSITCRPGCHCLRRPSMRVIAIRPLIPKPAASAISMTKKAAT